jgi:hypothetical protein
MASQSAFQAFVEGSHEVTIEDGQATESPRIGFVPKSPVCINNSSLPSLVSYEVSQCIEAPTPERLSEPQDDQELNSFTICFGMSLFLIAIESDPT